MYWNEKITAVYSVRALFSVPCCHKSPIVSSRSFAWLKTKDILNRDKNNPAQYQDLSSHQPCLETHGASSRHMLPCVPGTPTDTHPKPGVSQQAPPAAPTGTSTSADPGPWFWQQQVHLAAWSWLVMIIWWKGHIPVRLGRRRR